MGLFNRKKFNTNKLFNTKEMLEILSKKEYQNYTAESVETTRGTKYKLITIDESRRKEEELRGRIRKNGFIDRITGVGEYKNINTMPKYNNYQNAKRYKENAMYR